MEIPPAFLLAMERPLARVLAICLSIALLVGWSWGDRQLHVPYGAGFEPVWLAFVGLLVFALALIWIWNAVFRGRRDRDGVALSTVGLLVCTTGAVFAGTLGLVLELFWRAEDVDTVLRIALRSLWHAASAFTVLLVLSPVTLRALGSLPLQRVGEQN
ncbi:MAG: hypothetical protein GC161_15265 [Planctomycetaceae bacterium]|nr:hypothetical protein [Planctomycetaceae bacterium]